MTIEWKQVLVAGVASVSLSLVGCGGGGNDETPADNGEGAPVVDTTLDQGGESAEGTSTADATQFDSTTPDGAARVLLAALADARFVEAAGVVAPDSPGKSGLDQVVAIQKQYESIENPNPNQQIAQAFTRTLLENIAGVFADSTIELVTEEGDLAIVSIDRPGLDQLPSVQVARQGEFWFVRIPEKFVDMSADAIGSLRDQINNATGGADGAAGGGS